MAINTLRLPGEQQKKEGFFGWLENALKLDKGAYVRYVPHISFLTLLGVIYIYSNHQAEKTIREIDILEQQIEELRADYTTLKADYMLESKQAEVAKKVKKLGLYERANPVQKIEIEE